MPDGKVEAVERVIEAYLAFEQSPAILVQISLAHSAEAKGPNDGCRESLSARTYRIRDAFGLSPDNVCVASAGYAQ